MTNTPYLSILSGARVGASCYLYEYEGVRILFDCGSLPHADYTNYPNIPDPASIDAIFISHAHIDHMGAIAYAAAACKNAKIFMTPRTRDFVRYQLQSTVGEYIKADTDALRFHNRLLTELTMSRVTCVDYRKKFSFETLSGVTAEFYFFSAGHLPGAAMTYLKLRDHTVLYTGDFAAFDTILTPPMSLPDRLKVDTLILCGTHAADPDYSVYSMNPMSGLERALYRAFARSDRFALPVAQLPKGLEVLAMLDELISDGMFPGTNVYVSEDLLRFAAFYADVSDTFRCPGYLRPLGEFGIVQKKSEKPCSGPVIVFERAAARDKGGCTRLASDFTLHADYRDLTDLIGRVRPTNTFLVHVGDGKSRPLEGEALGTAVTYTKLGTVYNAMTNEEVTIHA